MNSIFLYLPFWAHLFALRLQAGAQRVLLSNVLCHKCYQMFCATQRTSGADILPPPPEIYQKWTKHVSKYIHDIQRHTKICKYQAAAGRPSRRLVFVYLFVYREYIWIYFSSIFNIFLVVVVICSPCIFKQF